EILKAWKTGDVKDMDAITSVSLDEYPEIRRALFDERNTGWVSSIEKQMKKDGDTFVIVGAGHLVGEEGILSLLQKKGYNPVQQ
ncbi:MAG TPA: TraB/GumN family protein, partial [Deltaproteobacteria bacterium]|nr:TraB/GumN family protein [Deltaproteobacteria bacterium]